MRHKPVAPSLESRLMSGVTRPVIITVDQLIRFYLTHTSGLYIKIVQIVGVPRLIAFLPASNDGHGSTNDRTFKLGPAHGLCQVE